MKRRVDAEQQQPFSNPAISDGANALGQPENAQPTGRPGQLTEVGSLESEKQKQKEELIREIEKQKVLKQRLQQKKDRLSADKKVRDFL